MEETIEIKTDDELIHLMRSSKTIQEWNKNREYCKIFRDTKWIIKNLDTNRLIKKSNIYGKGI